MGAEDASASSSTSRPPDLGFRVKSSAPASLRIWVVAEGTPAQLKQRVGATFCEVVPVRAADVPAVAHVLRRFAPAAVVEVAADRVTIPAPHGAGTLAQVATAVAAHGVAVSDIALRRPSLDEVFLALTAARPRFEVVA